MLKRSLTLAAILVALPSFAAEPAYTVDRGDIVQQVRERGSVEAVTRSDVHAPESAAALTIKWIIVDGTAVKKGDRLVQFDDHLIREQLDRQQLAAAQARAALEAINRELKTAELVGKREMNAAEAGLALAELAGKTALENEDLTRRRFAVRLKLTGVAIERARLALKKESDEVNKLALQVAELEREAAAIESRQVELSAAVTRKQHEFRLRDAQDEVALAKLRNEQRMAQLRTAVESGKSMLDQENSRIESLKQDAGRTTITAPHDGIAVYYAFDNLPAIGQSVAPGRKLLHVVDLSAFQLATRVPESQVASLRVGQSVSVKVDAFPDRILAGKVAEIASAASQEEWRRRGVRLYPVTVTLDPAASNLKPGMSAEVVIHIATVKNALRIPAKCVIRSGRKTVCAVDTAGGVRETPITLGISDGNFIEIKNGLKEGEKVLVPGKP